MASAAANSAGKASRATAPQGVSMKQQQPSLVVGVIAVYLLVISWPAAAAGAALYSTGKATGSAAPRLASRTQQQLFLVIGVDVGHCICC